MWLIIIMTKDESPKKSKIMNCIKNNRIDMVQRYDGVYSPCWESDFEYFVNKMLSKFRNIFKR